MSPLADLEAEVRRLHEAFERWFRAEVPNTPEAFAPIADALAEGFTHVSPRGMLAERETLLAQLRAAHASRKGQEFRIEIRSVQPREDPDGRALILYEEWQETAEGTTARRSSAWLRREPDRAGASERWRWRHVHETWMPEASSNDGVGDRPSPPSEG